MNNLVLIRQTGAFFAYLLLQIFFFRYLELFGVAYCFLYVNFLLFLSVDTDNRVLLLVGFFVGFLIDGFDGTLGIHAFACVLIMYFRQFILNFLFDKNQVYTLSLSENGIIWYLQYTLTLTFIHHFTIFLLQQFNFSYFFDTLLKGVASAILTTFLGILIQYLFFSPLIKNTR
ncbi:MAG: rod shape-determining protein MreD [Cytophagia bacterium]|nr:MAG: rod shape-determining protein MreD [Cytophagia bacterium]